MSRISKYEYEDRSARLQEATMVKYDLVVIGGGITGAGIALDAASRGLKVLLLEKDDYASGTSSKSTKLIHGGLRYLKQFEIGLVRETGRERAIVHQIAPHLVHPEKMLLPIVEKGSFSKWSASLAISVYDYLAGVKKQDRKKSLDYRQTLEEEPLLRKDILKSGILYSEYRTDDARLSFEIIRKAQHFGADVYNYCRVDELSYREGRAEGVYALDQLTERAYHFKSQYIVSAAGPWVDKLRKKDASLKGKHLRLTKGAHIVVSHEKLALKHAVYFDDFKGRMLFAIPRLGVTYIGTTDTDYKEDLNRVVCNEEDVSYILDATNHIFRIPELRKEDVISTWAGLRPLVSEDGKPPSEVSRKDEIFESASGLLSIAGGKLTGYRKMAERIVDMVCDRMEPARTGPCRTEEIKLTANPFSDYDEVLQFRDELFRRYPELIDSPLRAFYFVSTYGRHSTDILDGAMKNYQLSQNADLALIEAEIDNGLENESCFFPEDFFNRRTGMVYFDPKRLLSHFELICRRFREYYKWDKSTYERIKARSWKQLSDSMIMLGKT